jgi:hypothetical protein
MKLESIKDLKALIALCRKSGIKNIEVDGVKLELGDPAVKVGKSHIPTTEDLTSDGPTQEELLMWSVPDAPTPTESN